MSSRNEPANDPHSDAELATHTDAQPDPEPAAPSLPEPDPGVFHHQPEPPAASRASKDNA